MQTLSKITYIRVSNVTIICDTSKRYSFADICGYWITKREVLASGTRAAASQMSGASVWQWQARLATTALKISKYLHISSRFKRANTTTLKRLFFVVTGDKRTSGLKYLGKNEVTTVPIISYWKVYHCTLLRQYPKDV